MTQVSEFYMDTIICLTFFFSILYLYERKHARILLA